MGDDVHRTARGEEYARGLVGVGKLRRIARGAARAQGVPGFLAALRLANDDDGAGAIDLGEVAKESSLANRRMSTPSTRSQNLSKTNQHLGMTRTLSPRWATPLSSSSDSYSVSSSYISIGSLSVSIARSMRLSVSSHVGGWRFESLVVVTVPPYGVVNVQSYSALRSVVFHDVIDGPRGSAAPSAPSALVLAPSPPRALLVAAIDASPNRSTCDRRHVFAAATSIAGNPSFTHSLSASSASNLSATPLSCRSSSALSNSISGVVGASTFVSTCSMRALFAIGVDALSTSHPPRATRRGVVIARARRRRASPPRRLARARALVASRVVIQREPSLARARRDDAMTRVRRAMDAFRAIADPLERYVYLRELQRASAETFYRALVREPLELMPFVYTPTVGEACEKYHRLPIETIGVYITADDAGRVGAKLRGHWDRTAAARARAREGLDGDAARRRGVERREATTTASPWRW